MQGMAMLMAHLNHFVYTKDQMRIQQDWRVLLDSDDLTENLSGYDGVAFINDKTKQIILASSGTTFDFSKMQDLYKDMYAWMEIYNGQIPTQYTEGATVFADTVLQTIMCNNKIGDYEIIMTGHSSGGVISDLLSVYLKSKGIDAKSITFENPGSGPLVRDLQDDLEVNVAKDMFLSYNNKSSFLNELHTHAGEVMRLNAQYTGGEILPQIAWALDEIANILGFAGSIIKVLTLFSSNLPINIGDTFIGRYFGTGADDILMLIATGIHGMSEVITTFDKAFEGHGIQKIEEALESYSLNNNTTKNLCYEDIGNHTMYGDNYTIQLHNLSAIDDVALELMHEVR